MAQHYEIHNLLFINELHTATSRGIFPLGNGGTPMWFSPASSRAWVSFPGSSTGLLLPGPQGGGAVCGDQTAVPRSSDSADQFATAGRQRRSRGREGRGIACRLAHPNLAARRLVRWLEAAGVPFESIFTGACRRTLGSPGATACCTRESETYDSHIRHLAFADERTRSRSPLPWSPAIAPRSRRTESTSTAAASDPGTSARRACATWAQTRGDVTRRQ